jgi:hypothetical protein
MKSASGNSQRRFSLTAEIFDPFYYTLRSKDKIAGFLFYFPPINAQKPSDSLQRLKVFV